MLQHRVIRLRGVMSKAWLIAKENLTKEELALEEDMENERPSAFEDYLDQDGVWRI